MQRSTCGLTVLILSAFVHIPAWADNLLTNPSFEGSGSGSLTGWTTQGGNSPRVDNGYPGGSPAKDGSHWTGDSAAYGSGTQTPEWRQTVTVTAGQSYLLSVWVKTGGSPNPCSAYLQWKDGPNPTAIGQCTTVDWFAANTSGGWQQLQGLVTPTGTSLTICLRLSWDCSGSGGGGNLDMASVSTYSPGTNLLFNPSFETGTITGWTDGGLNVINNTYPCPAWNGSTCTLPSKDGVKWVGAGCGGCGGTAELRQTVTVTAQSSYRLSVWLNTGGSPNICSGFLQWYNGNDPAANDLCTTIDSMTGANTSGWQYLTGVATPTTNRLTICLRLSWAGGGGGGGGNFDMASVVLDAACPLPSVVSGCSPSSITIPPPGSASQTLTISGSNLLNVTGVSLTGPATISGSFVAGTKTDTSFQATFDLSTAPVGGYGVTVARDLPCLEASKTGAFTVNCGAAFTTISGFVAGTDVGRNDESAHVLTIQGVALGSLTGVKLRKTLFKDTLPEIIGSLNMVGADLQVTFDLSGVEAGRYDVVFTHPCGSGAGFVTPDFTQMGFLVYLPSLTNGSFEDGYKADKPNNYCGSPIVGDLPKPKHWDKVFSEMMNVPQPLPDSSRNSTTWVVSCSDGTIDGATGNYFGSLTGDFSGNRGMSMFQTIAAPGDLDLDGKSTKPYTIAADFNIRTSGGTGQGQILLIDGTEIDAGSLPAPGVTPAPPVIANTAIPINSSNSGLASDAAYAATVPANTQYGSSRLLTIIIRYYGETSASAVQALHVDNVRTTTSLCQQRVVWADNNGDGEVDMNDFAQMQACLTIGDASPPPLTSQCICFDRASPFGEITSADVAEFTYCATPAGIPWTLDVALNCKP
jgi:hypothetical protein